MENISFSQDGDQSGLHFTLEVNNRRHLANVMRNLRKIKEVIRIIRVKSVPG
ncbi:MAG: hypothetical protein OEV15_07050 [Gallionella sp.]|nr:hypothetical protein [Gallionella sp.]